MLFSGDLVVGDCVGLTSPRRSSKDGSVVLKVSVGLVRALEERKYKLICCQRLLEIHNYK